MTNAPALRPGWTPVTIGLMVLGFVAFWPLGLAMLAYILWGDKFDTMMSDMRGGWCRTKREMNDMGLNFTVNAAPRSTGNVAFDEYRARELKRLEEERKKLDAMREKFDEHMRNLRRAKDQQEFDEFLHGYKDGNGDSTGN